MNTIKQWNGKTIRFRQSDNYGCLTDMAQATGKRVNNFLRLDSTTEYLAALESVTQISVTDLVQVLQGGIPDEQGTWAHRKVCIRFAQWCSAEFAVQVDTWIEELLTTGTVKLETLSPAQMLLRQAQFMVEMEERQAKLEAEQKETKAIALEAKAGLESVRDQLASLKEFAVAQPPGLNQDLADQINQAFQLLGATLNEAGIFDKPKCYQAPWKDLGLTMRNSSINYDLNARYANALKQYEEDLAKWDAQGKPRGKKPAKPSRISILLRDNMLTDAFKGAQQVVKKYLSQSNITRVL